MTCGTFKVLIANAELQDGDSRVTIPRLVARFQQGGEKKRKKNLSLTCAIQNEPHKRRIIDWKPAKGQTSVDKATPPHTVPLDWHLFGVCHHSARTFQLDIFRWSAYFIFYLFGARDAAEWRTPGPDESGARVIPFDVFIMRELRSRQHVVFFFHLRCNKASCEWLWCYCSVEIDSFMQPFSENVMRMNYNELCSCLHLLKTEGRRREKRAELLLKIHQQCDNKSQQLGGFLFSFSVKHFTQRRLPRDERPWQQQHNPVRISFTCCISLPYGCLKFLFCFKILMEKQHQMFICCAFLAHDIIQPLFL